MTAVRRTVSLHEETVKKAASDLKSVRQARRRTQGSRNSRVVVRTWSDEVDAMLEAYIREHQIPRNRVKVIDRTTILVVNNMEA